MTILRKPNLPIRFCEVEGLNDENTSSFSSDDAPFACNVPIITDYSLTIQHYPMCKVKVSMLVYATKGNQPNNVTHPNTVIVYFKRKK